MNPKRLLGWLAVGVGVTALGNHALRSDPERLEPPLGRPLSTYRWRGFDIAYTEAGDPENPDLVLLHGVNAAGSSHEFRYIVDALAENYHVLAVDLPGFGHSDRPPLLYSASLYVTFIEDFLEEHTDRPTVVASSLSAAYAAAATEDADAVESFVFVCPTTSAVSDERPWLRSLLRSPVLGEGLYNLIVSKPSIRYFLADHGFAQQASITDEWIDYDWQTTHQPGARFAPASFLSGFLNIDIDLAGTLADLEVPTTIVWGRDATRPPVESGHKLAEAADARLVVFEHADLLVYAEHPTEFVETLREETIEA